MTAEEKLIIEVYEDDQGNSPIEAFLEGLSAKDFNFIIKKRDHFQKYFLSQLKNNRQFLENIRGADAFWELKFPFSPPYRAICIIRGNKIVELEMFKGSASDGKFMRCIPKCRKRAEDWDRRNL